MLELCAHLEQRGIRTWSQGEGLLDDLRPRPDDAGAHRGAVPTRTFLCTANAADLLRALPRAVVTASSRRRLTQATGAGPVDLLPTGHASLEATLIGFGLSALAFAFRPTDESWCDPTGARDLFERGELGGLGNTREGFLRAPRRFWIAARLAAQHSLVPTSELLSSSLAALPDALERLPQGAPARREVSRILFSTSPERGLAFLRESGVSTALFPGMDPANETLIAALAPLPALRWAAWLRGTATQRALVRMRVPHALARRVERIQHFHPIDRSVGTLREVGIRRVLQRLSEDEIEGLLGWRRSELAAEPDRPETRECLDRLREIEAQIERGRQLQQRSSRVRALALDGRAVMTTLGAGPGPHVGRALAHLANFVEADPDANSREQLIDELRTWAKANPDAFERRR
ncbi:MAG: hypothetical protein CL908_01545 [Deltaproteobacteria bacterium]|nr:hypothetical protein [Deltaproteobacteria bacterium]